MIELDDITQQAPAHQYQSIPIGQIALIIFRLQNQLAMLLFETLVSICASCLGWFLRFSERFSHLRSGRSLDLSALNMRGFCSYAF